MDKTRDLYWEDDEMSDISFESNYLLAIGIDAYQNGINPLRNAVKDAKDFVSLMQEKYCFNPTNCTCLYDEDATRDNIIETVSSLEIKLKENDSLLIYYSGHGYYHNNKGYIVPVDAQKGRISSLIYNSTIIDHIRSAKAKHILLISDSCFSGSLLANRDIDFFENRVNPIALAKRVAKDKSRWVIAAGRIELVSDGFAGLNSPFAEHLLRYFRTINYDIFPASSLTQYLKEHVPQTQNQTPIGGPITQTGDNGGEFVFVKKNNENADWKIATQINTHFGYRVFIEKYPNSKHNSEAILIEESLKEDDFWAQVEKNDSISAYYEYHKSYPNGKYTSKALQLIQEKEDEDAWKIAQMKNTITGFLQYQQNFPTGKYKNESQISIKEIQENEKEQKLWQQTINENSIESYQNYINQYPNGIFVLQAKKEVQKFKSKSENSVELGAKLKPLPLPIEKENEKPQRISVFYKFLGYSIGGVVVICIVFFLFLQWLFGPELERDKRFKEQEEILASEFGKGDSLTKKDTTQSVKIAEKPKPSAPKKVDTATAVTKQPKKTNSSETKPTTPVEVTKPIDKNWRAQYYKVGKFSEGYAAVGKKGIGGKRGTWGFVNKEGKEIVKPQYLYVEDFSHGKAKVTLREKYLGGATGVTEYECIYIDKNGQQIGKKFTEFSGGGA